MSGGHSLSIAAEPPFRRPRKTILPAHPLNPHQENGFSTSQAASAVRVSIACLPVRVRSTSSTRGGFDGFADPVAVNLAQPLADGMHVHVPRKGERQPQEALVVAAPTVRIGPPARSKDGGLIDVNRASEMELTALRGIGPALARRIVEYREKNGPFRSVEELVQVRGIGAAKLEGFRDRATVGP